LASEEFREVIYELNLKILKLIKFEC